MEESRGAKRKRSEDSVCVTSKTDCIQNGDFTNHFSAPPSLQHISAVSVAIGLWSWPDVRRKMPSMSEALEERILNSLSSSSLPTSLKAKISRIVPHITSQLLRKFDSRYCRCAGCHKYLCQYLKGGTILWTVEGTIDIAKSVIELFGRENSENDACHLYEAACYYCLEEYIPVLWKKIPSELKSQFRIGRIGDVYKHHVVIYWTSVLENNLDCFLSKVMHIDYESIYDDDLSVALNMITCSIRIGSKSALKYFWRKLTEEEKIANLDKWLLRATPGIQCSPSSMCEKYDETLDILCFLLSRVSGKFRLAEYFQDHPHVLKLLFENWPLQRMFLPTVLELLDCLQEETYVSIMKDVGSELSEEEGIGADVFEVIWNASPPRLKRSFLRETKTCAKVMLSFLELENRSMALNLLNGASEDDVRRIICYLFGWSKFCFFLYGNKLDLLCTLLSETTLPPECNLHALHFNCEDGMHSSKWVTQWHMCHEWLQIGDFQAVEMFLKWAFQSDDEVQDFKKNTLDPSIMYVTYIIRRTYELIEIFLNWYFDTEDEIRHFKVDFFRYNGHSHFKLVLFESCSRTRAGWETFKEFINYCAPSPEEMSEFKRVSLNYVETVLQKRRYEFATALLNWSLDSSDDVKRFKNDFVVSKKGIRSKRFTAQMFEPDGDWEEVVELINWSRPLSEGTIAELKTLIPSGSKIIAFLDSNGNSKSESNSNYENLPVSDEQCIK